MRELRWDIGQKPWCETWYAEGQRVDVRTSGIHTPEIVEQGEVIGTSRNKYRRVSYTVRLDSGIIEDFMFEHVKSTSHEKFPGDRILVR